MSKKNKIQKQLARAQVERNAQAMASGKSIDQVKPIIPIATGAASAPLNTTDSMTFPKEATEIALIRKDIRLSFILIIAVLICLLAIYFIDRSNPFLLSLANQIFKLISK